MFALSRKDVSHDPAVWPRAHQQTQQQLDQSDSQIQFQVGSSNCSLEADFDAAASPDSLILTADETQGVQYILNVPTRKML